MSFVTTYQLHLLIALFALGTLGTAFLFRKPANHSAWKLADLVWVVLGGIGALVAIIAGLYASDSSRLDRQIDLAYAASADFDRDAARFRLHFCDPARDANVTILCEKVEFLSASTAANSALPLFIAVTEEVAPLTSLSFLAFDNRHAPRSEVREMVAKADAFDIEEFLVFASRDAKTDQAVRTLRASAPSIAGDFQILAQSYDKLIERVGQLQQEWEYLQDNAHILILQILALCLVSFAAPFRLGKSLVELRCSSF